MNTGVIVIRRDHEGQTVLFGRLDDFIHGSFAVVGEERVDMNHAGKVEIASNRVNRPPGLFQPLDLVTLPLPVGMCGATGGEDDGYENCQDPNVSTEHYASFPKRV
jgi:hypothetical protein